MRTIPRGPCASADFTDTSLAEIETGSSGGPLLAAAAAGFLIPVLFGTCRTTNPQREEELAKLESELQSARDRVGQLESELSAARESVGTADVPARRASEPEPQTSPAPTQQTRSELTPDEVLRRDAPIADPEAAKESEPPAATTPTPIADRPSEPSRAEPDQVALAEPEGAASVYAVPDPTAPIVRSTSRSGSPGVAVLQVLAPERAGWTTEAQPTLYWHASEAMQLPGEFTLVREGDDQPLVRGRLVAPDGPSIQRIELSQSDISLDEGASYRWTVSFGDPEHSGTAVEVAERGCRDDPHVLAVQRIGRTCLGAKNGMIGPPMFLK
jgi:Domain of Unknown Function (DUF928)